MAKGYRFDAKKYEAAAAERAALAERECLEAMDRMGDKYGLCYFIGSDEGIIKIGYSKQPGYRLGQLQRFTPHRLTLLATVSGGKSRESYYFYKFAAHRLHGEWFARHQDILAEIERLGAGA